LTLDITPALRARPKVLVFVQGVTVADRTAAWFIGTGVPEGIAL